MAKRGENIYKRKDGRWEGRYIIGRKPDGKPRFQSLYAHTYTELRERLSLCKSKQVMENRHVENLLHCERILDEPFADWARYWLAHVAKPTVRPGTYGTYRAITENHLIPALEKTRLRSISHHQIQTSVCEWQSRLAAGTVQGIVRVLKNMLNSAEQRGLCVNPIRRLKIEGKAKKPRVLSLSEQRKLERAVQGRGGEEYLLCLYSGMRLGELCALRWTNVDFEANAIQVSSTVQRVGAGNGQTRLLFGRPKSESSEREVPLPRFIVDLLRQRRWAHPADTFVFERGRGLPLDPRTVQSRFSRLMKRIGIEGAHLHTLRHTYATRCLEHQVGVEVLSDLLGHSSPQVTLRCYAHCTQEQKRKSVDRLKMLA